MKSYELTKPATNTVRESLEDIRMLLAKAVDVTVDDVALTEDSRTTLASRRTQSIDDTLDIIEADIRCALQIASIGSSANCPRIERALRSALYLLGKRNY